MYIGKDTFKPFENEVWLATPTPHPEMLEYIQDAYNKNWGMKDNRDNR